MTSNLRREIAAVFVFSMAILALELTYTKFFSITLWYQFGFLIVSSAMLGFATAGVALALLGDRARHVDLFRLMTWSGWAVLASYAALTRIPFSNMVLSIPAAYAFVLFLVAILLFVPFFFLGLTISWILRERSARVGAVYAANLVGSAGGAIFFLLVFDHFPGTIAIFLDTLLIVSAATLVARTTSQRLRLAPEARALSRSSHILVVGGAGGGVLLLGHRQCAAVAVSLNFGFGAVIWLAIAAYAGASAIGWRLVSAGVASDGG
jgi:hypothetical protein